MSSREIVVIFVLAILGIAGAAVIAETPVIWPGHDLFIFRVAVGTIVACVLAIAYIVFAARRRERNEEVPINIRGNVGMRNGKTFLKIAGGSGFEVHNNTSDAETFMDLDNVSGLNATGNKHLQSQSPPKPEEPKKPKKRFLFRP